MLPIGKFLEEHFSVEGDVAVVTGGTGVLGSAMAGALAQAGAKVAIVSRRRDVAAHTIAQLEASGGQVMAIHADVLDPASLQKAQQILTDSWGAPRILVNAAGGNVAGATISEAQTPFDVPLEAFREVVDLNFTGTWLSCQAFGPALVATGGGSIVNVSSMAAGRPLTRVGAYGAAKAAVESMTRWLAIELPRRFGAAVRVNAIAPGFFIAEQNRSLLMTGIGNPTERGQRIIDHTPAGRFGQPNELISTLLWLCSHGASFVNGTVVPVDGGFSAFSGV